MKKSWIIRVFWGALFWRHNGISRLREFMEDVFKEFVQQAKYLMVDETTELVGVETPEGRRTEEECGY